MDPGPGVACVQESPVGALAVGVRVGVEEQIEPGRRPEVEELQSVASGVAGGDVGECRKKGRATPDLVGLRVPHGDKLEKPAAVLEAEVLEVGDDVVGGHHRLGRLGPAI